MHSLKPHVDHRIARLQAEAEERRLIALLPAPLPAGRRVAPWNRRIIGITAAISAAILCVTVAAFAYDASPTTTPHVPESLPTSIGPVPAPTMSTDQPVHLGGTPVLRPR